VIALLNIKTFLELLQALLTCLALISGGFWTYYIFLHKRERFPRAHISLNAFSLATSFGTYLSVKALVKNTGNLLLELYSVELRIQQILPLEENYEPRYLPAADIFDWPLISLCKRNFDRYSLEIEPNEEHQLFFDFMLPRHLACLKVYMYVQNRKKARHSLGWTASLIYSL
jgi:hypothetical protein